MRIQALVLFGHWRVLALVLASTLLGPPANAGDARSFPGALGFGASSLGGRGGDVYHVTHLGDSGPGSLRHGIESAAGPRTIVFETGGTIDLQSPLTIQASNLTIAGQTAPGGIGTRGYTLRVSGASDVVIRHLRVRVGDVNAAGVPGRPGRGNADLVGDAADGLSVIESERVIVDHVSASWGMDETLSVTKSQDVTVQHSLISESLNDSFHTEGLHGYGSLVRGEGRRGYSFVGNLWSHHVFRSPGIGGQQEPEPGTQNAGLDLDLVNNVMYDWGVFATYNTRETGLLRVEFRNNVLVAGASALCRRCMFNYVDELPEDDFRVFHEFNRLDSNVDGLFDPLAVGDEGFPGVAIDEEPYGFQRPEIEALPALRAYDRVVREVGASLARDAIDRRLIRQLVEQTGTVIDSQDDVGGWPDDPVLRPAPTDADRDGMADAWECVRGLDDGDPDDRNRFDLSSEYTNLEVYLDHLVDPHAVDAAGARWVENQHPFWRWYWWVFWGLWQEDAPPPVVRGVCEPAQ